MGHSENLRALLDGEDIPYEIQDFNACKITYIEQRICNQPVLIEFSEPLDGIPGTLGAMRELTVTITKNVTAGEAFDVMRKVVDQ